MWSRTHAEPVSKLAIAELVSEWVQLRHAALKSGEVRGGWESQSKEADTSESFASPFCRFMARERAALQPRWRESFRAI